MINHHFYSAKLLNLSSVKTRYRHTELDAHGGTSFLELSGAHGGVVAGGAVQRRVCRERGVGSSTSNLLLCSGFCSSKLDDLGCRSVVDLFHRLFLGFATSEDKVSNYCSVLWVDLLQLCSILWSFSSLSDGATSRRVDSCLVSGVALGSSEFWVVSLRNLDAASTGSGVLGTAVGDDTCSAFVAGLFGFVLKEAVGIAGLNF
ncbi:hypothetical protein F2Q68_00003993 [Brassica cretica]|uniref:Uncharacterized protein n=1 Tax=Brassica cretica TaxID=69181 RepID=A0A8S9JEP6_BRACR|nr:hypothetical protein F2Q68_00003993 [Brassica cretica]